MTIAGVTRELLVRYLDTWTPAALHAGRRATFAQVWSGPADATAAEAALRVFAEFGDLMRNRKLAFVPVATDGAALRDRLDEVAAQLRTPVGLAIYPVSGVGDAILAAALKAAGSAGAPLLVYAETDALPSLGAGRPIEVICVLPPTGWTGVRADLRAAGFTLTTGVEVVGDGPDGGAVLVGFATSSAKSLEAFKDALWAVDEYAGVHYREPGDPDGHLLDISLVPHPGPLRRVLLARLAATGPCTVTELRHFAMTETVYRTADATRVLTALLKAGAVTSDADHGRLAGDVTISLAASSGPTRDGSD